MLVMSNLMGIRLFKARNVIDFCGFNFNSMDLDVDKKDGGSINNSKLNLVIIYQIKEQKK